jgi:predicted ATPase
VITRIEVDGFKSLHDFAVDLDLLTAIVGPNGVGKSNLFDVLQLISRLASMDVSSAFGEGRGSRRDQFSRTATGVASHMSLALELLLAPAVGQTRLRYEVDIDRSVEPTGVERLFVRRVRAAGIQRARDSWIGRRPELSRFAHYGQEMFVEERAADAGSPELLQISLPRIFDLPGFAAVSMELRAFRFLHLDPARLRTPSDRASPTTLGPDGANLPTALADLQPSVQAEIRADLVRLVPSFRSFEIVPVDDEFRLDVQLITGQRLPARVLSDGTLRLLALFTLLRSASSGSVVAIEEPENGIHPTSLRAFMEELVGATTPGADLPPQVLLNSHSPAIVAALDRQPRSLVFTDLVRPADGVHATRMRHIREDGDPDDRGATFVASSTRAGPPSP